MDLLAGCGITIPSEPPEKLRERAEGEGTLMVTVDPATHKILFLLSRRDVKSWGELAANQPRELAREHLEAGEPADGFVGRELARRAGYPGPDQARVEKLVSAAYHLFTDVECIWVELGFLKVREGLLAVRCGVELDGNAAFRHPELADALETDCPLPRTERERNARAAGVEFLELEGDIGLLPGGTGFGLAAVDLVRHLGGGPADLMDSGGEANPERIKSMMDLLLDDPKVTAVLGCRYAGLTRADGWAKLMVQYIVEKKPSKPIVLRVAGNAEEEARRLFEEAATQHPQEFAKVWVFASDTPVDNAAREAVSMVDALKKGEDPFGQSEGTKPGGG